MNISYNWLKDLIDIDLSAEDLSAQLTRVGITVEGVHPQGDDVVLDIDLTSNRPDCLSHLGISREIAVITGARLKTKADIEDAEIPIPLPAVLAFDVVAIHGSSRT
jgi:phenylalanyl-tRNA synthetase beta chain